jgi:hypothetical protein
MKIRVNSTGTAGPPPTHAWKDGNPIVHKKPDVVVPTAAPKPEQKSVPKSVPKSAPKPAPTAAPKPEQTLEQKPEEKPSLVEASIVIEEESDDDFDDDEAEAEADGDAPVQEDDVWTEVKPRRIAVEIKTRNGKMRTIMAHLNKQTGTYVA